MGSWIGFDFAAGGAAPDRRAWLLDRMGSAPADEEGNPLLDAEGNPRAKTFGGYTLRAPCGTILDYRTLDAIPLVDTSCPCGDSSHLAVRWG